MAVPSRGSHFYLKLFGNTDIRIYLSIMANEKREIRTYKATERDYKNAMKVAKKKKQYLAQEIEKFIQRYYNEFYEMQPK